jgi:DNA-binding MarR family transcriptional regulator
MTAAPERQPPDLMHLLPRAERLLARRLKLILTEEGHTPDGWRVLSLLSDGAGHHMTEIAEHAFLPAATLTKLVDHLVDDNLVYRRVDDLDRRRIRAYLTPRGRRLHQQVSQRVAASVAELPIADGDRELLTALLARVVDCLDSAATAPAGRR